MAIKDMVKDRIRVTFLGDMKFPYRMDKDVQFGRDRDYMEWIRHDSVDLVNRFVDVNKLYDSAFIKVMDSTFKTDRFGILLKKWIGEYMADLVRAMDYFSRADLKKDESLALEDNPLNRYISEEFSARFKASPRIRWVRPRSVLSRVFVAVSQSVFALCLGLNSGVTIFRKKKKCKVMRESLWGLAPTGGYYFHDDFLVDENTIKAEDLLLFARKDSDECAQRRRAYQEARLSRYESCYLPSLKMRAGAIFSRIFPLYIMGGMKALLSEKRSANFSLFSSISNYFIYNAMPYEKIFSNYEIASELGHCCFSPRHIVESIVCSNMGARYYLMHWSDVSIDSVRHFISFLGCDKYLAWGPAHIRGSEGSNDIIVYTGYVFKKFIKDVFARRDNIISDMGIARRGKVVSFFDEPDYSKTSEGAFLRTASLSVNFWESALKLAIRDPGITVLMKPKDLSRYGDLPDGLKERFISIRSQMEKLENVYIVDAAKWSFIECVGISDVVVTEGMTSSATIAIICGIEGLYLNEAGSDHPFSRSLKGKIVFDHPDTLIEAIQGILAGTISARKTIPEDLIRKYDKYPDDRGIDMIRGILAGIDVCPENN